MSVVSTIAIVDDDEAIREALDDLVRSFGYQSAMYSSAEDFLQRADRSKIACMLLDVNMPGLSGIKLQEQLNGEPPKPPVIFFTSQRDELTEKAAIAGGAIAFLHKPADARTVIQSIEAAVRTPPRLH